MAEGLAAGLAQTILTQLSSRALREITSARGVEKEVKRLENTVTAIKEVLTYAENLQLSNNDVRSWLRRIQDATYDAEDVIDGFATEARRSKLKMQGGSIERVSHFASSSNPIFLRFKMARRIKDVRGNLKDILDDQAFGLEKKVEENRGFVSERGQTHSYVPEGKVVGRDLEREEIVKLLLDSNAQDGFSVIAIRGMGGIGKTALAQLVYNDKRVVDNFMQNRMWVCVSDEFAVQKITEKIIRSGTGKECPNLDMDQLQSRLREYLGGKRYLLVLDDVWNEEFDKWEELRDLLRGGVSGSKIIVTTRNEKVGLIMGAGVVYHLPELSEGDCWTLFKERAFQEGEEQADPELVGIGRDIVKKCVGMPLAAKTLGGLCFRAKKQAWEFVRDNEVWRLPEDKNGILSALRISYNHLPFYLKRCFVYCSIFPKDFDIPKKMLIKLWIAQGFITSSGDNRSLEDIGNEYVEVLMWRSFFQEPVTDDCDNLIQFKMHDLVHDLAKSIAGIECFTICRDKEENFPDGVRHLFFDTEVPSSPSITGKPSNIRTLVFTYETKFFISNIFSSLKLLRVLQFRDDHIDHLPNSIDKLKHLRYLQIECEKIIRLPESITNLQNLQVLNLRCKKLEKLPDRIQNMISLKHIDFGNTPMSFFRHMPFGLKELKSLETLTHFFVGKNKTGCELNVLNALTNLGGSLEIRNLQNVKNTKDSEETNLKAKGKLQILRLHWSEPFDHETSREAVAFEVLGSLEPNSNLKKLEIHAYEGTGFPRWMMEPHLSLPNVVEIELCYCAKCEQLPPFSHLPSLKVLKLSCMNALQCIEGGPEGSPREWFPSLRLLEIRDCPNLESCVPKDKSLSIAFPCLVELNIRDCPKLRNMPLLPSIKKLDLSTTRAELVHSIFELNVSLTSLQWLRMEECEGLESWPNPLGHELTSLRTLFIGCSPGLPSLPQGIQHLTALQNLSICNYCEQALPEWMANITSLQCLGMQDCPYLQFLPEWVLRANSMIQYLLIDGCPQLKRRYNKEIGEDRHQIAHIKSNI